MVAGLEERPSRLKGWMLLVKRVLLSAIGILVALFMFTDLKFPWHHIKWLISPSYRAEVRKQQALEKALAADRAQWVERTTQHVLFRVVIEMQAGEPDPQTAEDKPTKCVVRVCRLWADGQDRIVFDPECEWRYPYRMAEDRTIEIYSKEVPTGSETIPPEEQELMVKHGLEVISEKMNRLQRSIDHLDDFSKAQLAIYRTALGNPVLMPDASRSGIDGMLSPPWGQGYIPFKAPIPTANEVLFGRKFANLQQNKSADDLFTTMRNNVYKTKQQSTIHKSR